MRSLPSILVAVAVLAAVPSVQADPPFLKPADVIALVGGEDMVVASEYGYLELLLQRALPLHRLKVRSLAWEGDTVFEQPRDLNYPALEAQLDEIGATVVIMQFGQMENLAGTSRLPEFIKAYEKLIERVRAGGKRRVVIAAPQRFENNGRPNLPSNDSRFDAEHAFGNVIGVLAYRLNSPFAETLLGKFDAKPPYTREGIHQNAVGQQLMASNVAWKLAGQLASSLSAETRSEEVPDKNEELLRRVIAAKNRLWFHYYRPQNWAFLAGDRTEQPSSRDHKDPSKRWFPEEMKQWLPLIEAKEKEIWALAGKASSK